MAEASTSAPTPKKTVLKETPQLPQSVASTSSKTTPTQRHQFLKTCFEDIVNRKTLHLNSKGICDILLYDLNVEFKNLSTMMKYVISECLCNYMKIWPGWEEYKHKGPESLDECFAKFKEYLKFKIDFIIANQNQFCEEDVKPKKPVTNAQTQTESMGKENKPEAPYTLVICGQPNILNNIVFVEVDNNVVIKQHTEKLWKQLIPTEFLNYPYVYVSVSLPNVKLSRSNIHEYKRYITECGDTAAAPEVNLINYVVKDDPKAEAKVYSYEYISAYFAQFVKVFNKIPGVKVLPQLQVIFNEFLKDIKESCVNNNSMGVPYTVCYNIGQKTYIRNKKMVVNSQKNKESNALNYCEIVIPKLAFSLSEFNVEEDVMTPEVTFNDLNRIAAEPQTEAQSLALQNLINNSLTYQCLLCPKHFSGETAFTEAMDHFRYLHKGEQAVLCFKCKRQFEIYTLASQRWSHECANRDGGAHAGAKKTMRTYGSTTGNGALRTIAPAPTGQAGVLRNQLSQAAVVDTGVKAPVSVPVSTVSNNVTTVANMNISPPVQLVYGVFSNQQQSMQSGQ